MALAPTLLGKIAEGIALSDIGTFDSDNSAKAKLTIDFNCYEDKEDPSTNLVKIEVPVTDMAPL